MRLKQLAQIAIFLYVFLGSKDVLGQSFRFSGSVFDQDGAAIPKALILISGFDTTLYTQTDGSFEVYLKQKPSSILVRARGYGPLNIVLPDRNIPNINIVLNYSEDTTWFDADKLMQRVMKKRADHRDAYTYYQSKVYKKNIANFTKVPFNLWLISGRLIPSKKDTGVVYVSEEYGIFDYGGRSKFDQKTEAFHAAGKLQVSDWNEIQDFDLSLYHKRIYLKDISSRGYYSPLHNRGFLFYNYTPSGVYWLGSRKVYRVKFEPRQKYRPVLSGFIDIYSDSLTLAATEYKISSENTIEFLDSIKVRQDYYYHDNIYKQATQEMDYFLDLVGFEAQYHINIYYDDFTYQTKKERPKYDYKIQKLEPKDIIDSTDYWEPKRKWDASSEESDLFRDYNHHDVLTDKQYSIDSIPITRQVNGLEWLLLGQKRVSSKYSINWEPLWHSFGYNTVEGGYLKYQAPFSINYPKSKLIISPELRYGFSDTWLKYRLKTSYLLDNRHPKELFLEFGHSVSQFNDEQPISPVINALYTLFLGNNYIKLYGKDFINVGFNSELINGLELNSKLEYAYRYPRFNTTNFAIIPFESGFEPNNPIENELATEASVIGENGFVNHGALTLNLELIYQFGQLYKVINGQKRNLNVNSPKIYINYRQGIPSTFSKTDFSFLSVGVNFSVKVGNIGLSKFDFSGGGFIRNRVVEFADYKHFNGVQTFFLQPTSRRNNSIKQFSTLPYYQYSTNLEFVELHYEHNFDGFLLGNSRAGRKLKIHSLIGFNYLNTLNEGQFLEFFFGIDNILRAVRFEIAGVAENFEEFRPSFRIGIDFDYGYYNQNRKR